MATEQKSRGIALIVLSAFFFALMSAFVTMAGALPFFQKALFRNAVAMGVSGVLLLARRTPLRVPAGCGAPLALRIACGMVGVFCNYYAIDHLLLASSNSLNKLSPFFAILFAAVFLKERVNRVQLGCIALALVGSALLIFPNLGTLGFASGIALLGGVASGGAHVALRALRRGADIDSSVIVFLFCLVSTGVALVPSLLYWEPMSGRQVLCMLLAGASCAVAQYALTGAYRYAPPKDISIYDSSQILFSGLLGYLLFRQVPGAVSLVAYGLITLASALLFLHYRREKA
nr:DMT family transporter [uncultured Oscillibacter sp.]